MKYTQYRIIIIRVLKPESTIESTNDQQNVKNEILSKLLFLLVFGTLTQYFLGS